MKILITGATGFLGKHLLKLAITRNEIDEILVLTRRDPLKLSPPDPRIRFVQADLGNIASLMPLKLASAGIDHVIHAAGLYNFNSDYTDCYINNVVATQNLLAALDADEKTSRLPLLHFTSSYSVGYQNAPVSFLAEGPLEKLPPQDFPYAWSKAMAEQIVLRSHFPKRIFRLGILVGDSRTGKIEKLDGPYAFIESMMILKKQPLLRHLNRIIPALLPIPAHPATILPILPVDLAAETLIESLFNTEQIGPVFGVYPTDQVSVRRWTETVIRHLNLRLKPVFLSNLPDSILTAQERYTHLPADALRIACHRILLKNDLWRQHFPATFAKVPQFLEFQKILFDGHREFSEGSSC